MMQCPWRYCQAMVRPERAQERITSRTVFTCPECRGRLPRYSATNGRNKR